MGPAMHDTSNGAGAPQSEAARTTAADDRKAARARPLHSIESPTSTAETRLDERLARVLRQKRGPDAVVTGVLCAALLFGLIGLAAHFLWIVAIIIMALGLGYAVANSRRDRVDMINQQADGHPVPAPDSADRNRDLLPVRPSRPVRGKRFADWTRALNSLPVGAILPPDDYGKCMLMRCP
jgi:hypothetical protein